MHQSIRTKKTQGKRGHCLGCSTVKRLSNLHGGDIKVGSEVGKSSIFEFLIKGQPKKFV